MNKVIIIGCPGAGKSTFSKALKEKTGLPLFHLDMLFWNNDKTHVDREVFDKKLSDVLELDNWIIDGNYKRTLEMRLKACDTVFLLDFPVEDCISGVNARIGKQRSDMPWVEQNFDEDFKQWIIDFPNNELPYIYSLLKVYSDKKIIVFKSHKEIDNYIKTI